MEKVFTKNSFRETNRTNYWILARKITQFLLRQLRGWCFILLVIVKRRSLQDSLLSWRVRSLKRWFWNEKMTNNIISLRAMFYRKRVVKFLRWGHHCLLQNITFPIKRVGVQKCLSELFSFWRVKNFSKTRCETNVQ